MARPKKRKTRDKSQKEAKDTRTQEQKNLDAGRRIVRDHPLFGDVSNCLGATVDGAYAEGDAKNRAYSVNKRGEVYLNNRFLLTPKQWAHALVECKLHLGFGHFDAVNMPGYEVVGEDGKKKKIVDCNTRIWNLACDAYIDRYLAEAKFGESTYDYPFMRDVKGTADEREIYRYLLESGEGERFRFHMDMEGLEDPVPEWEEDPFVYDFPHIIARCAMAAVSAAGGHGEERGYAYRNISEAAAAWFINHYPLLGSLAASFRIVEDAQACIQEGVQVAAVDVDAGVIYVNPAAFDRRDSYVREKLEFVLAHEYLHAGLQHRDRCQGRDPYLWNVACDYVINGWLVEMGIGRMPEFGVLYDEGLKGMSAEEIYDRILSDIRGFTKDGTFRGYGKGDIFRGKGRWKGPIQGIDLDEFYRDALRQGLEYSESQHCGHIPAGLAEEIRALAMPPVPWDVELAEWFELRFPAFEPRRTYARPSRRQGSTPEIPRPRYVRDGNQAARTFGVVLDTSGSMSAQQLGMALGSIASYADAREVPYARVVFCDAEAYDAGYLAPADIAGRVEVKGRGGTVLQPGIDLLEGARDFPKDGPILIITDGLFDERLSVRHEHAYLIPKGRRLPFRPKGKVFYFE